MNKQKYNKPVITTIGFVNEITKWSAGGAGEWLGGPQVKSAFFSSSKNKGPADFGS